MGAVPFRLLVLRSVTTLDNNNNNDDDNNNIFNKRALLKNNPGKRRHPSLIYRIYKSIWSTRIMCILFSQEYLRTLYSNAFYFSICSRVYCPRFPVPIDFAFVSAYFSWHDEPDNLPGYTTTPDC